MPETDPLTKFKLPTNLRALVVDGDDSRRQHVEDSLHAQGLRVIACASVEHGRELFDDHALVITPLNGDNQAVLEFVSWLRTRAGRIQPYVMGLGEYHAPASEWHGFNEFVSLPFEGVKVHSSVEAARRWHGWNVGVNSLLRPEDDDLEEMTPEPAAPAPVAPLPVQEPPAPEVAAVAKPAVEAEPANELLDVAEIFSSEVPELTIPTEPAPAEETQPQQKEEAEPFDWSIAAEAKSAPEETQQPNNGLPRELQLSMAPKAPPAMSASLHQQITEASPFGLLLLDDAANLIYANPQHRNVLGLSVEAAGGLQGWLEQGCVAEPGQQRAIIESWYEQVWRRRLPMVMTMRSAESLLKEVEFRPSPLAEERLLVAIFDVTDARREEEAMRASEARFRSLFLQAPLGVVVVNAVGNVTDASLQFEQLVGCSRLDMRRLGLEQFFSESDYQLLRKMSFSARAGANVAPLSLTVLPRRGEGVPVDCDLRIVKNAAGASVFTAYYFRPQPITAPPMPAPTAKPAPTPNRLLQAVSDLVLELHADGRITSHLPSRDFAELLPRDGSLAGKSFDAAFPAFAEMLPLQDMMQSLEESLDSEVRCEFKYRPSPEEAPRTCEARLVPLTTLPAEPSFGLTIRDLTPSASSQPTRESTSEEHDPYEFTAIQLLRQAAIITNEKGRICNVNPAAEEMFGYNKEELMGGGLYKLFLPEQPKEFAQKISEHINRHRCWIGKSSYFRKDGSVGRAAVELVPFTEQGTKGFFGLIRDITSDETESKPSPTPQPASHEPDGSVVKLHRARNDFQVLSSLLSLQANDVSLSDSARLALQESKDRVSAVALVYRLLDGATGEVDFSKFACEMAGQVLRTQQVSNERIRITGPTKSLLLPQKLAISLGLILQELLTSTVHSFGPETEGKIEIKLDLTGKEGVLSIQDNGPFHSESELEQRSKGVGWKVVEALTQQIDGEIKILSDLDNEIRLRFHLEPNANSGD